MDRERPHGGRIAPMYRRAFKQPPKEGGNLMLRDTITGSGIKYRPPAPPLHGIHSWVISSARRCRNAGLSKEETTKRIYSFEPQCRRPFQPLEVENAVSTVFSTSLEPKTSSAPKLRWRPDVTEALDVRNIDDWKNRSLPNASEVEPKRILELTLKPNPDTWICIGRNKSFKDKSWIEAKTLHFQNLSSLSNSELVVPCWMTAKTGMTTTGKTSEHTLENTGEPRFIVVDLDEPPPHEHASILWKLADYREPSLVLSTGGKGLHAWFPVTNDDEAFWDYAVLLGADERIRKNKSQFVRMPNGRRINGKKQEVIFLNPNLTTQL
jgi:hypothetical protein